MILDFLQEAKFAKKAHEGQVRKYTGEPYVTHCIAVAEMVHTFAADPDTDMVTAALLHDTVEDTDTTMDDIFSTFGEEVAESVWYLTKPESFVGNRAQRKKLDRARLGLAPEKVRFVKICDIMHNAPSIKEHDPKMWTTWHDEALLLLDAMDAHGVWSKVAHQEHKKVFLEFMKTVIGENDL